jgi:hypothetical protein
MRIVLKDSVENEYMDDNLREVLKPGAVLRVYIEEIDTEDNERWLLLDTGVQQPSTYNSDNDSNAERVFQDPDLPEDYSNGTFFWVKKRHCEHVPENNKGAKSLLKQFEWNVQ